MVKVFVTTSGAKATSKQRDEFKGLVLSDRQVGVSGLETRILAAHLLVLLYIDGELASTAAIKNNPQHQETITKKANFPLSTEHYLGEVGYLHTAKKFRNQGYADQTLKHLIEAAKGKGLFATIQSKNSGSKKLFQNNKFVRAGEQWQSGEVVDEVQLFIRANSHKK